MRDRGNRANTHTKGAVMEEGREIEVYLEDMVLRFDSITSVRDSLQTGRLVLYGKNPEPEPRQGFFRKFDYEPQVERAAFASKKWLGWAWV